MRIDDYEGHPFFDELLCDDPHSVGLARAWFPNNKNSSELFDGEPHHEVPGL